MAVAVYALPIRLRVPKPRIRKLLQHAPASSSAIDACGTLILDLFLTSLPSGDSPHAFEVEVFLHTPASASQYAQRSRSVGSYLGPDGMRWRVAVDEAAHDILFVPAYASDLLTGSIDLGAKLRWLAKEGVITGKEYFNGLAVGVEPRAGSGAAIIKSLWVDYD